MIIAMIIAIFPSLVFGWFIYKKDILEKEPISMLVKLFFFGVLITIPASFLENFLIALLPTDKSLTSIFLISFIGIALVEESLKYFIFYETSYKSSHFNHIYDGIVYAVFVSLGFATLENILYVFSYGNGVGLLRAIVSVPAHVFFGVYMGYKMGFAKYYTVVKNNAKAKKFKVLSLLIPVLLHGVFNFLLLLENINVIIVFFAFVIFLYVMAYLKVKKTALISFNVDLLNKEVLNENNI